LRRAGPAAALVVLCATTPVARGDDYVAIRGAYYREPSTRVIQPMIEVERDSPQGIDVAAHFLVDAITSASLAAGTAVDAIFTEIRDEAGLRVRKRWERSEVTLGYKYSAESDYWSHGIGGYAAHRFWGDTARIALSLGLSLDAVSSRNRTPDCSTPPSTSCPLDTYYAGLTYTQAISPVLIAQIGAETAFLDGWQGNLYRSVPNFRFTYEKLPSKRLRNAITPRVAYVFPSTRTSLQLQYRYYFDVDPGALGDDDPWGIHAHTFELRVFQSLTPSLEVRLAYRQEIQSGANFWCDTTVNPGCYSPNVAYASTDPKLGPMHTEYPEVKLFWEAEALEGTPLLGWFAAGTFEISYGYYIQSTSYGNAHVLQMGYRMPY
jgi:hypothetical protein